MTSMQRGVTWLTAAGLLGFLLGCHRTSPTTSPAPPPGVTWDAGVPAQGTFDTESGPFAAGKKVLVANGCFRCHTVNGVRGPVGGGPPAGGFPGAGGPPMPGGPGGPGRMMGSRAPDLGEVGKDPTHTVDWIMKYVRNPKSVKPEAKMPQFEGRIKEEDLRALGEYLASPK